MFLCKQSVFKGKILPEHITQARPHFLPPPKQNSTINKIGICDLSLFSILYCLHLWKQSPPFINFLCLLPPALSAVEVCQQYLSNPPCHNIYKNGSSQSKKSLCVHHWHGCKRINILQWPATAKGDLRSLRECTLHEAGNFLWYSSKIFVEARAPLQPTSSPTRDLSW